MNALIIFITSVASSVLPLATDLEPIEGARDWQMVAPIPGVPYTPCVAKAEAPSGDSTLFLDPAGTPVLVAGRADWGAPSGEATVMLSIDGSAPEALKVTFARNQLLMTLDEPARLARLRSAQTLDWTLPSGGFHANVAGLGLALDAVLACRANGPITAH